MHRAMRYLTASLLHSFSAAQTDFEVLIINNLAHQRYNISIVIGALPQTYSLLFDIGSYGVWVPRPNSTGCALNCPQGFGFDPTNSSSVVDLHIPFDARYDLTLDQAVLGSYGG
jgi:hypothetical protein